MGGGARARPCRSTPRAERPRSRCPPGPPAAGGCGCAARACPTPAASPATCTPRSRSWSPRSPEPPRAGAVRGAGRCRTSTRGGPDEPATTVGHGRRRPVGGPVPAGAATAARPRRLRRAAPACTRSWCGASSRSAWSRPTRDSAGRLWFTPRRAGHRRPHPAAADRPVAQLRRPRAGARPARPHRRPRARPARASPPASEGVSVAVDLNRLTQKSQEALHDAQTKALRFGHTEVDGEHLLLALLDQPDGLVATAAGAGRGRPGRAARTAVEAELGRRPRVTGPGAAPGQVIVTQRLARLLDAAEREARRLKDEYVSVEHLRARAGRGGVGHRGRAAAQGAGADPRRVPDRADPDPRQPAGHLGDAGGRLRGAGEVRARPGRRRPRRQARPGHRPRRRDPPGHPDPVPQDQEQPGPDRRPGRRQDRHRRGPGPADRPRRRARGAARQDDLRPRHGLAGRRGQVPRRVRGAAQGRAERGQGGRGPDPALRRRAAHRRRGRRRRGRDGRRQHAQADAGPRRAAHDRRHHPRRVPQAHREGRRAGAPLPAGAGRRADRRGHHLDPARACASGWRSSTASGSRTAPWSPRRPSATATSPTGSCRTRRSTWSTRPAPGCAPRSTPCRPSWTSSPAG